MKQQAIQLQAPLGQTTELLDRAEFHTISRLAAAARKAMPHVILFAQGAFLVAFGFALMFISAIIGG